MLKVWDDETTVHIGPAPGTVLDGRPDSRQLVDQMAVTFAVMEALRNAGVQVAYTLIVFNPTD